MNEMNFIIKLLFAFYGILTVVCAAKNGDDGDSSLNNLLGAIRDTLYSSGVSDNLSRRPQQYYYPPNNGISLRVYEALRSITINDDLECIPRLLCEAAAGGRPGFSGRDIKFDKLSLTKFMSYLNIGTGKSSPLLTFARAALLGASNRGDPYSCIINYSKCPKDQSRLLYYLNNHRGGFFQYFDKKDHRPGNYYYQNQYNPNYQYQNYYNKYKTNKIIFENSKDFIGQLKKKGTGNGVYAKKYTYSSFKFPKNNEESLSRRPMVFPEDRSEANNVPRILSNSPTASSKRKVKFLDGSSRFSKKLKDLNFFPDEEETTRLSNSFVSDRLPPKFHFPLNEDIDSFTKQPTENSFFPPN